MPGLRPQRDARDRSNKLHRYGHPRALRIGSCQEGGYQLLQRVHVDLRREPHKGQAAQGDAAPAAILDILPVALVQSGKLGQAAGEDARSEHGSLDRQIVEYGQLRLPSSNID
jgi:hypothetical protein